MRPQWGALVGAGCAVGVLRESAGHANDLSGSLGLSKKMLPVGGTRKLSKRDMLWNTTACPKIQSILRDLLNVFVDGVLATCEPAREVPLARALHAEVRHAARR